jgi:hypothetical protein
MDAAAVQATSPRCFDPGAAGHEEAAAWSARATDQADR